MPEVRERVEVRQGPTVPTPSRVRWDWVAIAAVVVGLIAVGVWLILSGDDGAFDAEGLAAAEDAVVVEIPQARGISVEEFAAAEQMVTPAAPILVGISPAELAAAESAVVVLFPVTEGIGIDEFALLESQVGR